MRLVIIGGSDAGTSAALRAREVAPDLEVTVVVADAFPNYSICGLPFYLSGEVPDPQLLAHRTVAEIEREGVGLLLEHVASQIDPAGQTVTVVDRRGQARQLPYDRLVIGTGAVPVWPDIPGLDLPGVFPLHTMEDSFLVHEHLLRERPESVVIVGSGYIGLEMADALTLRGLPVTLVGRSPSVLPTVAPSLGRVLEEELGRHEVEVINGMPVQAIRAEGSRLVVAGPAGFERSGDVVLVAVGVRPNSELAAAAGVSTGIKGAIRVNGRMETNLPGVYAAGDCVETWHRLLGRYAYLPLGTTAHKQGRVAGENAAGGEREFAGSLGTQVVKVFELVAARTGLRDHEALEAGFDPVATQVTIWDHKRYYPGAEELLIRVTGDRQSGRLLGVQMVGPYRSEVAKRIDIYATALFHGMRVEELNDLDLSYTPPVSSPWDPVQAAAQAWAKALDQRREAEVAAVGVGQSDQG